MLKWELYRKFRILLRYEVEEKMKTQHVRNIITIEDAYCAGSNIRS